MVEDRPMDLLNDRHKYILGENEAYCIGTVNLYRYVQGGPKVCLHFLMLVKSYCNDQMTLEMSHLIPYSLNFNIDLVCGVRLRS
jgi:hypothetical protein